METHAAHTIRQVIEELDLVAAVAAERVVTCSPEYVRSLARSLDEVRTAIVRAAARAGYMAREAAQCGEIIGHADLAGQIVALLADHADDPHADHLSKFEGWHRSRQEHHLRHGHGQAHLPYGSLVFDHEDHHVGSGPDADSRVYTPEDFDDSDPPHIAEHGPEAGDVFEADGKWGVYVDVLAGERRVCGPYWARESAEAARAIWLKFHPEADPRWTFVATI